MSTTILITGSNGLLGQKLIHGLLMRNKNGASWNIIATSKGENRIKEKVGYFYESFDITSNTNLQ